MPLFGPPNVEKMEAHRDVGGLIKALNYKKNSLEEDDTLIRASAANALGNIGDKRACEPLIATLNDGDRLVRDLTIAALGDLGDSRAVEPLVFLLTTLDGWSDSCYKVAVALGNIGDASAVEPLLKILDGEIGSTMLQGSAAVALGKIGDPRAVASLEAICKFGKLSSVRESTAWALEKMGRPVPKRF